MIHTAWRIVKRKYTRGDFTGEGARVHGGRWNSPGFPLVYTAESRSLAAMEMLVHLDLSSLLGHYAVIGASFDSSLITAVEHSKLPRTWRADPPPDMLRSIGNQWINNQVSAVLQVPSVLIPDERNFLLNPRHPDFVKIKIGKPVPFGFDTRLVKK